MVLIFSVPKGTEYKGEYWAEHPTIRFFWEVFHELPLEKKKQFLCKCLSLFKLDSQPCG